MKSKKFLLEKTSDVINHLEHYEQFGVSIFGKIDDERTAYFSDIANCLRTTAIVELTKSIVVSDMLHNKEGVSAKKDEINKNIIKLLESALNKLKKTYD